MKWFAIKGPDGRVYSVETVEGRAWTRALQTCSPDDPMYRAWFQHDFSDDAQDAVEAIGYSCVEVELAEPGTADALKRARLAWDALAAIDARVDCDKNNAGVRDIAVAALGEVLGRVTDNAASDGGEGEKP